MDAAGSRIPASQQPPAQQPSAQTQQPTRTRVSQQRSESPLLRSRSHSGGPLQKSASARTLQPKTAQGKADSRDTQKIADLRRTLAAELDKKPSAKVVQRSSPRVSTKVLKMTPEKPRLCRTQVAGSSSASQTSNCGLEGLDVQRYLAHVYLRAVMPEKQPLLSQQVFATVNSAMTQKLSNGLGGSEAQQYLARVYLRAASASEA
jgi:hypothetical protein